MTFIDCVIITAKLEPNEFLLLGRKIWPACMQDIIHGLESVAGYYTPAGTPKNGNLGKTIYYGPAICKTGAPRKLWEQAGSILSLHSATQNQKNWGTRFISQALTSLSSLGVLDKWLPQCTYFCSRFWNLLRGHWCGENFRNPASFCVNHRPHMTQHCRYEWISQSKFTYFPTTAQVYLKICGHHIWIYLKCWQSGGLCQCCIQNASLMLACHWTSVSFFNQCDI